MVTPYQIRRLTIDLGVPGDPWEVTFPHTLTDREAGIVPDHIEVVALRLDIAGTIYTVPGGSVSVVAVDDTDCTVRLPPAAGWPIVPNGAEMDIHIERVWSGIGFYSRTADPAVPPLPLGMGGGAPAPHGSTHLPDGSDPVDFLEASRELHVDQTNGNDLWRGTLTAPMQTVQGAIDRAENFMVPSFLDPVTIIIHTGIIQEGVIIHQDGINLIGACPSGPTHLLPPVGTPALVVTNATPASLAAFDAAGGYANPPANYALLAAQADPPPNKNVFHNIIFGDPLAPAAPCVEFLGVGDGNTMFEQWGMLVNCMVQGAFWASVVNRIVLTQSSIGHTCGLMNVSQPIFQMVDVYDELTSEYDPASPMGQPSGGNNELDGIGLIVDRDFNLITEAEAFLERSTVENDVELADSTVLGAINSHFSKDLHAEANAEFDIIETCVMNDIICDNGPQGCLMAGAFWENNLFDATFRFDHVDQQIEGNALVPNNPVLVAVPGLRFGNTIQATLISDDTGGTLGAIVGAAFSANDVAQVTFTNAPTNNDGLIQVNAFS